MKNERLKNLENNKEELERCKRDPLYFYNNYARPEGSREITQAEYDDIVGGELIRRNGGHSFKRLRQYPLTPDECFFHKNKGNGK